MNGATDHFEQVDELCEIAAMLPYDDVVPELITRLVYLGEADEVRAILADL